MSQRTSTRAARATPAAPARQRQRLRLIDACISALHHYGPSRTTVGRVVALAGLSPGIVRFYFDSKAAMLVASLEYLAAEFEARVMVPVRRLEQQPVQALRLLVELYVDADIASPRKVSVWYSFWGEASSRQEYYDICGRRDQEFAALVRRLISRLVDLSGAPHLDAAAVALGLIGVLEMHWQDFAFQNESDIDRPAAVASSLAYLRSVFPQQFGTVPAPHGRAPRGTGRRGASARRATLPAAVEHDARLPAWAYDDETLLAAERERLLRPAWQLAGYAGQLRRSGDYFTAELAGERVAVLLGQGGRLRALRNACPQRPHALLSQPHGHGGSSLECPVHGLAWTLDGRALRGGGPDLSVFSAVRRGAAVLVQAVPARDGVGAPEESWRLLDGADRAALSTFEVAADWKLVVEQWLEKPLPGHHYLAPNHLLLSWRGGSSVLQVLPVGRGRSRIRRLDLMRRAVPGVRHDTVAADPVRGPRQRSRRALEQWLLEQIALAESTQGALGSGTAQFGDAGVITPQLRAFRADIAALLPAPASRPSA